MELFGKYFVVEDRYLEISRVLDQRIKHQVFKGFWDSQFYVGERAHGHSGRLVVKVFAQSYITDYLEILSPVAKLNSVRVILSLVGNPDRPLYQMDCKIAFLHRDLQEEWNYLQESP